MTTTVCTSPSRSRVRIHQTEPLRTGQLSCCQPSSCEIAWPVTDPSLRQRLIDECLVAYLHDGKDAWDLGADGVYRRVQGDTHPGEEGASHRIEAHGAQRALMDRYGSRTGGRAA